MNATVRTGPALGAEPKPVRRRAPRSPEPEEPQGMLETAGDIAQFSWQTLRQVGYTAIHYAPEIARQAGILTLGSLPIIMLVTFLAGGSCGLEMTVVSRQVGATTLAPGAVVLCNTREVAPFVFGYILCAKVGCGIVAELGAMRVREEVDAMDVIGVRSVAFLVCSRFLAAVLVLPFIFVLSQAISTFGAFLVSGVRFADISTGTWTYVLFSFLDVNDVTRIMVKGVAMSAFVLLVSLYLGYRTRGGPVEVGVNTARSMAINIIGVTVINGGLTLVFWGAAGASFPIA
jgi:phospholipid/cholesterol/gamma-HCH transport system permease protein